MPYLAMIIIYIISKTIYSIILLGSSDTWRLQIFVQAKTFIRSKPLYAALAATVRLKPLCACSHCALEVTVALEATVRSKPLCARIHSCARSHCAFAVTVRSHRSK